MNKENGYVQQSFERFRSRIASSLFRLSERIESGVLRRPLFAWVVRAERGLSQWGRYGDFQYFGMCPFCRNQDGFLNVGQAQWFYCRIHKTKWCAGSNLFGCWREQSPSNWQDNCKYLSTFTDIKPVYLDEDLSP